METLETIPKNLKKEHWGEGPWIYEPDIFQFVQNGFICIGNRVKEHEGFNNEHLFGGFWKGYIIVRNEHPWFGKDCHSIECECHGGLTFCGLGSKNEWFLGFDCGHSLDFVPSLEKFLETNSEYQRDLERLRKIVGRESPIFKKHYRNMDYVVEQLISMTNQAKAAENAK